MKIPPGGQPQICFLGKLTLKLENIRRILTRFYFVMRDRSFLSPNTRFLRGAKFLAKNLGGLKIFPSAEKNKGCETISNAKFSSGRENKGYEIFYYHREYA